MKEFETMSEFMNAVMDRFDDIDHQLRSIKSEKACLNGEKLLDTYDLCRILNVTKRTIARYRQLGKIPYYMIDGRAYYKTSEVEVILNKKDLSE